MVCLLFAIVVTALVPTAAGAGSFTLSTTPQRVYKARDTGNQPLETWFFSLIVKGDRLARPSSLRLTLFAGEEQLESREISGPALEAMMQNNFGGELFDLPIIESRPSGWNTDRVEVELTLEHNDSFEQLSRSVVLSKYVQKTSLVFPFQGAGLVTQGPVHDRGHYGPGNHFAVDVIGLTDLYAPQVRDEETNEAYAGWKREVIAPADGVVVRARGDIPNNPSPGSMVDPAVLAALPDPQPQFTVPGNHIVIDHGNSEFSVLMHLDTGSVAVKAGDSVKQGDVVGRLGNSGDSYGPHLHYQLQAGPATFTADPLPVEFTNLPNKRLVRGTYFMAK